ncbi:MAG: 50S ribosomal protein L13 [Rickettsiales bacterium]|nr:50S ribosomal protein L13 [Rickettsiales bacterium]|tara:strand:- start:16281 stop:16742 length:462 start_codon:yes stop_codon:yes gene_type:complete
MKTFSLKQSEIDKKWIVIDATDLILGRVASYIANVLRGKNKANFTPHLDCGDNVIVINADKVHMTGNKWTDKVFYWHTGYPGGIKSRTLAQIKDGRFPERVVQKAVQRMLPKGPLGRAQLKNLHVYAGPDHPHQAQKPEVVEFAKHNAKNQKR